MKTILCFGDSNTFGTPGMPDLETSDRFPRAQRWPNVMAAVLGEQFEVIAEGHPGRNAAFDDPVEGDHKNGLKMLPAIMESHRPVDLLIVLLGTNDLKRRFDVGAEDIALALERLATANRALLCGPAGQASRLLYACPVPITESGCLAEMFEGGAAKSLALPKHLKAAADRQGADFIDLAPVASVDPVDGVHLTVEGQAAIGRAMAAKVQELLG